MFQTLRSVTTDDHTHVMYHGYEVKVLQRLDGDFTMLSVWRR